MAHQGIVIWYSPQKCYGYIREDGKEAGSDLFVARSSIVAEHRTTLKTGHAVEFEIGENKKGPVARKVRVMDE